MLLTGRQLYQARAALALWLSVVKHSRVHPLNHPAVRKFYPGEHEPMAESEIETLIEMDEAWEAPTGGVIIPKFAALKETSRVRSWLKRNNRAPVDRIGGTNLYHPKDILAALTAGHLADQRIKERYKCSAEIEPGDGE